MRSNHFARGLSRRQFMAASFTSALLAGPLARAGVAPARSDGSGELFKLGLQSYSLRGYTTDGKPDLKKALAVTKELGVQFWESYTAHVPMSDDREKTLDYKKKTEAEGVAVIGHGVVHFHKDEAACRKIFEFARSLGVSYLSADPDPDSFDLLDKLVQEYDIAVGIHNHGPGHRYDKIETIAKVIKDHHKKIGCCIDTGHFLRSKEDPAQAAEVFKDRVFGVHLKDVKNADTFTILGQGDLRTVDLLKVLAANNYGYCLAIEYEEKPENPVEDIKACLTEARKAIAAVKPTGPRSQLKAVE